MMSHNGPDSRDYEQVLTQLYSRKATRKAFEMIRSDFRRKTKVDLCDVIRKAQDDVMKETARKFRDGLDLGGSARTDAFKMIDYSTWLRYCKVERRK